MAPQSFDDSRYTHTILRCHKKEATHGDLFKT